QFKWSEWRSEYLSHIPQSTASLYMRLAKNQERLRKPTPEISNGLLKLSGAGELSIKKAAALLVEKKPRGPHKPKPTGDEGVAREWLKALAADELVAVLRELHDADYLKRVAAELVEPAGPTSTSIPAATAIPSASAVARRL